ncbi:hypothetical protein K2173_014235 [Erythroxylum novogranatense]|uniref:RING-type domain-containing protein n=1 Tax=Erythroxylum novogranatense TaxID=1862640 RepID=A0AAV8SE59_9ROSI|nr:hypothetical protein K2173_014235 [Erythroxylum novogranatense]
MAIAGLHNVSVLDSSFLRESHSETVRTRDDDGSVSTRASSLLQMWRELEDENVLNHGHRRASGRSLRNRIDGSTEEFLRMDVPNSHGNQHGGTSEDGSAVESDFGQWSPGPHGSVSGQEDPSSLREDERERVRQIFREWMTSGATDHASNFSNRNNSSRAEWLGENEQERVRIIREWVQMNSQHRGTCVDHREEQSSEVAGQIEQVLDGSVVNQSSGRTDHTRRGIRRLCGRQSLLDMLKKRERERKRELEDLVEHHAVSEFAHRNRIQSLLRGRFLRNDRMNRTERPTSIAASELGLLRQRHTVSDLREGFFSRLDHSVCGRAGSSDVDTSSNNDINGNRIQQTAANGLPEIIDECNEQNDWDNEDNHSCGRPGGRTDVEGNAGVDSGWQESGVHSENGAVQVSENVGRDGEQPAYFEIDEGRDGDAEEVNVNWQEGAFDVSSRDIMENETGDHVYTSLTNEILSQQSEPVRIGNALPFLSNHEEVRSYGIEDVNGPASASQEQWPNQILNRGETELFGASPELSEWRGHVQNNVEGSEHETTANDWVDNGNREEESQVSHGSNGFQEAVHSWLEEPSNQEHVSVGRMDSFYLTDDDNVYSLELRELLSRRSVSTLLRSSFRQSLDQLIQSYVERQSNVPLDWELEGESPSSALEEQDLEQQSREQNEGQGSSVQSLPPPLPSPPMPSVERLWDQDSQNYSWPHNDMHQRFGIEWDIINDLRIDMARLQQRMNNMQRMLEACMDMQLELQRSIRQEVSAALNRSANLSGICDNNLADDSSKWHYVRKGLCCICGDSSIDSLLYRCGHMCTCSKCANKLVQSGEKCPMCRAPVIEVIRAYSIL